MRVAGVGIPVAFGDGFERWIKAKHVVGIVAAVAQEHLPRLVFACAHLIGFSLQL